MGFSNRSQLSALDKSPPFHLFTRVTTVTWPRISVYDRAGDLFWGVGVNGVPQPVRAWTKGTYAPLTGEADSFYTDYSTVNLDGEYSDHALAFTEAGQIRTWVDNYNSTYPAAKLAWTAFYHLNIIDDYPAIVGYPDVVIIGKSQWNGATEIIASAQPYVDLIQAAGKVAGVLLAAGAAQPVGDPIPYSNAEVLANFHAVIDQPPAGLGLLVASYYYDLDDDIALISALQVLR